LVPHSGRIEERCYGSSIIRESMAVTAADLDRDVDAPILALHRALGDKKTLFPKAHSAGCSGWCVARQWREMDGGPAAEGVDG
jgi:hypothetical protein